MSLDKAHVLHWWSGAQNESALEYLLRNALVESGDGEIEANEHVLHVLGVCYPDSLVKLFEDNVDRVTNSYGLFEAVASSRATKDTKTRLFLASANSPDSWKRDFALRHLLRMKHAKVPALLIDELALIPTTPKEPYWTSTAGRFAQLACCTDDDRVWEALAKAARRVDVGQRLEMIEAIGSGSRQTDQKAIEFLAGFLDDQEVRVIPDSLNSIDPGKSSESLQANLFEGPIAGMMFTRLAARDFASHHLANKLGLDVRSEHTWAETDWSELRQRVRQALKKRKINAEQNDGGRK